MTQQPTSEQSSNEIQMVEMTIQVSANTAALIEFMAENAGMTNSLFITHAVVMDSTLLDYQLQGYTVLLHKSGETLKEFIVPIQSQN